MARFFQRKSLDDILAGAAGRPPRRAYGWDADQGPKPLWAIAEEGAPYGGEFVPAGVAVSDYRLAANEGPGGGSQGSAGPGTCSEHYPRGSGIERICRGAGDSDWANCVRKCLYKVVPEEWRSEIPYWTEDFLKWAAAHFGCWTGCLMEGPED
jgi:hypothetical protein